LAIKVERGGERALEARRTIVDFDKELDDLRVKLADVQASVHVAATETHDQIQERIGEAQVKLDKEAKAAQAQADKAGDQAQDQWQKVKADAANRIAKGKRSIDHRGDQFDADVAENDAEWAESDAQASIDFAAYAVENARVAILDAIDARAYSRQKAAAVRPA
jgi:hypothetical protein